MKALHIPIASDAAHFTQENEIFGRSFNLEFEWIERGAFWMLHISDTQGNPIALGVKLQPDWPLLKMHNIALVLLPNKTNSALNRSSLQTEFTMVACAII